MAAKIPDSNNFKMIWVNEEEFQTTPSKRTHSRTNDDKAIYIKPISFCMPENYYIDYDEDVIDNPSKESHFSCGEHTSRPKRGRKSKELHELNKNWYVEERPRKDGSRIDKFYRHKEKGFLCRSLVEVERYEKHGIHTQRCKKKTGDKEQGKNKIENDSKEMMANEKNIEPESDEMIMAAEKKETKPKEMLVAERKREAEENRLIVEEFL